MKKLTILLTVVMMTVAGCLWAQSHRHTDRSNEFAAESIANIDASDTCNVDEVFGEVLNDNMGLVANQLPETAASVAKVAIISVFTCLALIILIPTLVIVFIIYLISHNRNKDKGAQSTAATPSASYAAPSTASSAINDTTTTTAAPTPANQPLDDNKQRMERGCKKMAIGLGFTLFGLWCDITIFTALGVAFLAYGVGLIVINLLSNNK